MRNPCNAELIVEKIKSANPSDQEAAIVCLKQKVYAAIFKATKDKDLANELFQELCILLFERVRNNKFSYTGKNQFFQYVHSSWKRWWSKMNKSPGRAEKDEFEPGAEEQFILFEEQQRKLKVLKACRQKIGVACLEIIDKRIHGTPFIDILEELGEENLTVDTLRMRHHRCMKDLKACMYRSLK